MTQHNNNLSLHQQGKDVALLQSRLITMGHTIVTPEILSELFGESTQQAVIQFQQAEGLPVTDIVDDATAQAIVSSFEADKTVIKHTPVPIHPTATQGKPVVGSDPLPDSPVDEGGGGIDMPLSPATGVPVHTQQGDGHPLDPSLLIREEIAAVQLLQQQHGLELSGVVDEQMAALLQREPGLEVAPIGFGSVKTMSAPRSDDRDRARVG